MYMDSGFREHNLSATISCWKLITNTVLGVNAFLVKYQLQYKFRTTQYITSHHQTTVDSFHSSTPPNHPPSRPHPAAEYLELDNIELLLCVASPFLPSFEPPMVY